MDRTMNLRRTSILQEQSQTVQECPFCIKNGKVNILSETEDAYVVVALKHPGCYLVVPKQHIESILDLPVNWQSSVADLLRSLPEIQAGEHFNLSYNQGYIAGQRVSHVHAWVIIRSSNEAEESRGIGLASLISNVNTHTVNAP